MRCRQTHGRRFPRPPIKEFRDAQIIRHGRQQILPRSLLRWREPDHEAQHAVRTDYLAPARFGEVATGFDLRLFGGLQGCAVLGFDALILAALPLAVRTVLDRGTMELRRGQRAGDDAPCSTGFERLADVDSIDSPTPISTRPVAEGLLRVRIAFLHFRRPQVWASKRPGFFSSQT